VSDQWTIDRELVERIARVARLELTEEEIEKFTGQLKVILESFRELDEVDTEGVEPSFHPQELSNVLREDETTFWSWNPLENTEHKEGSHFKGPRIQ
jgi:aspartyl-tRNA(Asn)/glutamyl-tRNA(Gln) amidotransferase subunit C